MSDTQLSTFPSNKTEAIAFLCVQKKDYDNPTPEQIAEDYRLAYKAVRKYFLEHKNTSEWH